MIATKCRSQRFYLVVFASISATADAVKILWNATVYTVNVDLLRAEAIAVSDDGSGLILAVGDSDELLAMDYDGAEKHLIDMEGRLVLPGFQDAHLHAVEAGINSAACHIDPEPAMEDIPYYFDDCPDGGLLGDQGWLVGSGVDVSYLPIEVGFGARLPIEVLDDQYPDTPVLILDNSLCATKMVP